MKKLNIFISHPSDFLTDNKLHGDGLLAFEIINRLANRGHNIHVACINYDIKKKLRSNIKLYKIKLRSNYSIFKSFEYIYRVRKLFYSINKTSNIDLIHQLNPVKPGLSVMLFRSNLPLILGMFMPRWNKSTNCSNNYHSIIYKSSILKIVSYILKQFDKIQQRNARALILSTKEAVWSIYNFEKHKDKIFHIPFGVDIELFNPRNNENVNPGNSILFVGRLDVQKGVIDLINAFNIVTKIHPNCKLNIAGIGKDSDLVKQTISTLNCKNINLLGFVVRSEIPVLIQNCNIFCIPSLGEPFGAAALEAMACGKPIVATNSGGLQHIVNDKGGIKVEENNPKELSDALLKLLSDQDLRDKMGKFNRKLVEKEYSWERVIDKMELVYYKCLDD